MTFGSKRSWLLKNDPEQAIHYYNLHSSYRDFSVQQKELGVEFQLNAIVEESLKIPRFEL